MASLVVAPLLSVDSRGLTNVMDARLLSATSCVLISVLYKVFLWQGLV